MPQWGEWSIGGTVTANIIRDQLPRQIADNVELRLVADPWMLRVQLVVIDRHKRKYECWLEPERKIPDWFIAHLCAMVL